MVKKGCDIFVSIMYNSGCNQTEITLFENLHFLHPSLNIQFIKYLQPNVIKFVNRVFLLTELQMFSTTLGLLIRIERVQCLQHHDIIMINQLFLLSMYNRGTCQTLTCCWPCSSPSARSGVHASPPAPFWLSLSTLPPPPWMQSLVTAQQTKPHS